MSWSLNPGGAVSRSWDPYSNKITFETLPYYTPYPFNFIGTSSNQCGTKQITFCFIHGPNCQQGYSYFYSPNPATEALTLTRNSEIEFEEESEIVLYDELMNIRFSTKSKKNEISIPLTEMKNGIYFLHVNSKKGAYREQILIKR